MPLFDKKCAITGVFYGKTVKIRWRLGGFNPAPPVVVPLCKMGAPLICGRDNLFFGLHLILGGKLDICGRDDLQRICPPFALQKYGNSIVLKNFFVYQCYARRMD